MEKSSAAEYKDTARRIPPSTLESDHFFHLAWRLNGKKMTPLKPGLRCPLGSLWPFHITSPISLFCILRSWLRAIKHNAICRLALYKSNSCREQFLFPLYSNIPHVICSCCSKMLFFFFFFKSVSFRLHPDATRSITKQRHCHYAIIVSIEENLNLFSCILYDGIDNMFVLQSMCKNPVTWNLWVGCNMCSQMTFAWQLVKTSVSWKLLGIGTSSGHTKANDPKPAPLLHTVYS